MNSREDLFAHPDRKHVVLFVLAVMLFSAGIFVSRHQGRVSSFRVISLVGLGGALVSAVVRVMIARSSIRRAMRQAPHSGMTSQIKAEKKPNQPPEPTAASGRGSS